MLQKRNTHNWIRIHVDTCVLPLWKILSNLVIGMLRDIAFMGSRPLTLWFCPLCVFVSFSWVLAKPPERDYKRKRGRYTWTSSSTSLVTVTGNRWPSSTSARVKGSNSLRLRYFTSPITHPIPLLFKMNHYFIIWKYRPNFQISPIRYASLLIRGYLRILHGTWWFLK